MSIQGSAVLDQVEARLAAARLRFERARVDLERIAGTPAAGESVASAWGRYRDAVLELDAVCTSAAYCEAPS